MNYVPYMFTIFRSGMQSFIPSQSGFLLSFSGESRKATFVQKVAF